MSTWQQHWSPATARVVGSAALEFYGKAALLRSVAVVAELRGAGLGHRLTGAALDLARQRGVTAVYLLTETAADFFPRFGFRPTQRAQIRFNHRELNVLRHGTSARFTLSRSSPHVPTNTTAERTERPLL